MSYIIFYDNNEVYMLDYGEDARYRYGLPGGKIDEGETSFEALNRELGEEMNYSVNERGLIRLDNINIKYKYFDKECKSNINLYIKEHSQGFRDLNEGLEIVKLDVSKALKLSMTEPIKESLEMYITYKIQKEIEKIFLKNSFMVERENEEYTLLKYMEEKEYGAVSVYVYKNRKEILLNYGEITHEHLDEYDFESGRYLEEIENYLEKLLNDEIYFSSNKIRDKYPDFPRDYYVFSGKLR
jgi:hypothetical protein